METNAGGVVVHHVLAATTHLRVETGSVGKEIAHAVHLVRSVLHEGHANLVLVTGEISLCQAIRLASRAALGSQRQGPMQPRASSPTAHSMDGLGVRFFHLLPLLVNQILVVKREYFRVSTVWVDSSKIFS